MLALYTLREKYPNTELFMVRIQSEYGPEITPYLDTFQAVIETSQSQLFSL